MHNRALLKYKLHHIFFWMLVFGIWYYFRYEDYTSEQQAMQVTLLKVADLALLIYLTNYLLIPKLLYRKYYLVFVLSFVGIIVGSSIFKMYFIAQITGLPDHFDLTDNLKERLYDSVLPHFFLVIAGAAFRLILDYSEMQQRLAAIAKEKAETELNFLKSQINPHFLFNSLNSVYFLIDKTNHDARNALHKFSEMLRYQLYEMGGEPIPIEKEIKYLRDYVDLQHLRKDEKYEVTFSHTEEVKNFLIEPLLLIPFVENSFKHISHYQDEPNYIRLTMDKKENQFMFEIQNSKETMITSSPLSGGIGLANVKRRLELLYPGRHTLKINDSHSQYFVQLTINIIP